jgi:hypothetical protein
VECLKLILRGLSKTVMAQENNRITEQQNILQLYLYWLLFYHMLYGGKTTVQSQKTS